MKTMNLIPLMMALIFSSALFAQTARVQIIHNSADAAASVVDIYVNDVLAVPDLEFRQATPFVDLPAGVNLEVSIAPGNSSSSEDAVATYNFNLEENYKYVIIANGIINLEAYSPATPFDLYVYPMGQEMAMSEGNTDVLVFHGSTDAPTVDVYESKVLEATAIDNFVYGQFAGYLELPTADYVFEIRDETGMVSVASYDAPLQALALQNQALVVLASGFLNPAVNNNGAAFGLFAALPSGGALVELPTSKAMVQVIHNAADAAAESVDVYLNDALIVPGFMFRTATPFVELPAGVNIEIAIAPANSMSVEDAIATFEYKLASGETYVVVANGIVNLEAYSPATPFDLYVFPMGQEMAMSEGNTDVLVFHGSTDAPTVDVYESALANTTIIDDIAYGEFNGYLELETNNYILEIIDETGNSTVAAYNAPLQSLSLENQAIVVLASGFLNPESNSNGPAFGLYVALSSGGSLVPLPLYTTSISQPLATIGFTAYPNPASDIVNISFDEFIDSQISLSIYNSVGQLVSENDLYSSGSQISFNVSNLDSGMYYVKLNYNQTTTVKPIQVVK